LLSQRQTKIQPSLICPSNIFHRSYRSLWMSFPGSDNGSNLPHLNMSEVHGHNRKWRRLALLVHTSYNWCRIYSTGWWACDWKVLRIRQREYTDKWWLNQWRLRSKIVNDISLSKKWTWFVYRIYSIDLQLGSWLCRE